MFIAFDIGNVLCKVDLDKFKYELAECIRIHSPEVESHPYFDSMFFLNSFQALQDLGFITIEAALHNRFPNIHKRETDALTKTWLNTIKPSEMMLNFMDDLRYEGVKIALLSNIGLEHTKHLKEICPRMFHNTYEHLSFEVGARKPSKLYYQSFLMDHADFVGAVYVDDREENLKTGKKYSFKSFKFNLDKIEQMPLSKQKMELDKIRSYVFDRKYDNV